MLHPWRLCELGVQGAALPGYQPVRERFGSGWSECGDAVLAYAVRAPLTLLLAAWRVDRHPDSLRSDDARFLGSAAMAAWVRSRETAPGERQSRSGRWNVPQSAGQRRGWKWMYRCELCGGIVPPRTPSFSVVVETREKRYPRRPMLYPPRKRSEWKDPEKWRDDPGGVGHEIVREARTCPACAGVTPTERL